VNQYKIKKIDTKNFKGFIQLLAWAVVDDKSSVVFAGDDVEGPSGDSYYLRSMVLDSNGKVKKTNTVLTLQNGLVGGAAAFWFDGQPAAAGHGLIFIAQNPENTYNVTRFSVAKFDASGELLTEFQTLLEITAANGRSYAGRWLAAATRDGIVGLIASAYQFENTASFYGQRATEAYFMEVSSDGALLASGVTKVKVPRGGNYRLLRPYTPAWNGKSWVVPVVLTILKRKTYGGRDYTDEVGYQLYLLSAIPSGGPLKVKLRRIAKDNTEIHWPTFVSPVFLPQTASSGPGAPATGATLSLLYTKATPAGSEGRGVNAKKYESFIQQINGRGKKAGAKILVQVPEWQRQFENEPNLSSEDTYSFFSNAIAGDDNKVLLTHTRSAEFYNPKYQTSKVEMQLDLYSLDPATGKVSQLASSLFKGIAMFNRHPLLHTFGTALRALNPCRKDKAGKQTYPLYFSEFSVK